MKILLLLLTLAIETLGEVNSVDIGRIKLEKMRNLASRAGNLGIIDFTVDQYR